MQNAKHKRQTSGDPIRETHQGAWEMTKETVSWIMAVRKYGTVRADEMFPDEDEPRPRRPARKLARTVAPRGHQRAAGASAHTGK
jgi:hypothetical protein